jgi:hypothetical protein
MRKIVVAAALLALVPTPARADGDINPIVLIPLTVLGGAEGSLLGFGISAAVRSERSFAGAWVMGSANVVVGGIYAGAFIDACFKARANPWDPRTNNAFANGLNYIALVGGIAHLTVGAWDLVVAIRGRRPGPVALVPTVMTDSARRPVAGAALQITSF